MDKCPFYVVLQLLIGNLHDDFDVYHEVQVLIGWRLTWGFHSSQWMLPWRVTAIEPRFTCILQTAQLSKPKTCFVKRYVSA
jgi:hypothetical protein